MNVPFFSSAASKRTPALIFDIDSGSVGVAIARYRSGKSTQVLFTHRELIRFGDKQDAESLAGYIAEAISRAGTKALESFGSLKLRGNYSVHVILHAPWVDSQSQRAESILQTETIITPELLQQFMAKKIPETHTEGRIQFDRHVTNIELNGYSTADPYKKKAQSIAMTILESSMSEYVHGVINNAFAELFPNHEIHIDSFLFITTQLPELFKNNDAYTLIDIGGEHTSLTIVNNNTVRESAWANFGTEHLVRAISKEGDNPRPTAVSELTMFLSDMCTPAQCKTIEGLLSTVEADWTRTFGDACAQLNKSRKLPTKVFIAIDPKYSSWFISRIGRIDFGHFTITGNVMDAEIIMPDLIAPGVTFLETAKRDALLSTGVLFVDK
ncbi:hypothetical protein COB18_00085 [Candidatus Kaiserbacteria bacterium]|nr:MAG: hypothetical protein COB18_00085 [Candidatus Kaiserbacteria bacterium]